MPLEPTWLEPKWLRMMMMMMLMMMMMMISFRGILHLRNALENAASGSACNIWRCVADRRSTCTVH